MAVPLVGSLVTRLLAGAFGNLAKFLLSGLLAQIIVKLILYAGILGAMFLFYKNFSATSLDYALRFFNFAGFGDTISQIQYYYGQLPATLRDTFSYFQIGAMLGFLVNNYISTIFLSWVMRRFG